MRLADLLQDRDRLRNRLTVPILMSTDHAEACARAAKEVKDATDRLREAEILEEGRMSRPRTDEATQRLAEAQEVQADVEHAAAGHLVDFVVESIPSDDWEDLLDEHPPTDEQRDRFGPALDFNPRTFPEVAVDACLVEPSHEGVGDIRQLRKAIPEVVWQQLFGAVMRVNRGANAVPKSLTGSVTTTSSGRPSRPRSN